MPATTIRASLAVLAISAAFAGAAPAHAAGRLAVASPQDPGSWDPIDTFLVNWNSVASSIFEGLTYRTPDLKLVPGLATSWEELDGAKRIRFRLRENVRFHDGEPFDAEAVKFTFERLLGEEGGKGPQRSNYTAIDRVEVIDPLTVDFHLRQPDPVLLTKLASYGAMIVPPRYIKEKGDAFFNANPVGTGPFRFVSYQPKVAIQLAANPDYWGGAPKLSELEFRFIAEPSTAVAELQAGRIDIIAAGVPIGALPTIEADPKLAVLTAPSPTVSALRFDTSKGVTKDERVRRALTMAVDRDAIIQSILAGKGKAIASFQSVLSFGNDPALAPLPYDPQGATALLKEAGVEAGAAVQIDVRGNDATFNEVAQAVAAYLSTVGIVATVKPYEMNVLLNDIIPQGKTGGMFQQGWGGWTFDYDNTAYLMYHSGEKWNPYDKDPKLDAMLEAQRLETDKGKREGLLQEIARYTAEHALEMPLYSLDAIFAINKRVKDFTPVPDNRLRLEAVTVE